MYTVGYVCIYKYNINIIKSSRAPVKHPVNYIVYLFPVQPLPSIFCHRNDSPVPFPGWAAPGLPIRDIRLRISLSLFAGTVPFLWGDQCGEFPTENQFVVSTHFKDISQIRSFLQVGVNIKKYLKPPPRKN